MYRFNSIPSRSNLELKKKYTIHKIIPDIQIKDIPYYFEDIPNEGLCILDRFSNLDQNDSYFRVICEGIPEADGSYAHPICEVKTYLSKDNSNDSNVILSCKKFFEARPEMQNPLDYAPIRAYINSVRDFLGYEIELGKDMTIYAPRENANHATIVFWVGINFDLYTPLSIVYMFAEHMIFEIERIYSNKLRMFVTEDYTSIKNAISNMREVSIAFKQMLVNKFKVNLEKKMVSGGTSIIYQAEQHGKKVILKNQILLLIDLRKK